MTALLANGDLFGDLRPGAAEVDDLQQLAFFVPADHVLWEHLLVPSVDRLPLLVENELVPDGVIYCLVEREFVLWNPRLGYLPAN